MVLMGSSFAPPPAPVSFTPVIYTGNGSTQSIAAGIDLDTGEGLVWIKGRSGATNSQLFDTVRGATNRIVSNSFSAEAVDADGLTAFSATGFDIGANANLNTDTATYVAWVFAELAGFFDIVTYTGDGSAGRTVAHSLGVAPELMLVKCRSAVANWRVYSATTTATHQALLGTAAFSASATTWNDTAPTSAVFSLGTSTDVNASAATFVAYLFATLAGVSKVGSYTGTAADIDVDCAFAAAARFVLIKRTDSTGGWYMWDSARGIVSGNDPFLFANSAAAEDTSTDYIDTFATGFTVTAAAPIALNEAGGTYIYLAIA